MKSAVCLLIPQGQNALAISRRNDTTRWGFPGGKVDPGETNLQAILREVSEEIGLTVEPQDVEPLYCAPCSGDPTFWVSTYILKSAPPASSALKPEQGFTLAWMKLEELAKIAPFADYNRGVMNAYERYIQDE